MRKFVHRLDWISVFFFAIFFLASASTHKVEGPAEVPLVDLRPVAVDGSRRIEFVSGNETIGTTTDDAPLGILVRTPDSPPIGLIPESLKREGNTWNYSPVRLGPLVFTVSLIQITPSLIERRVEVLANEPAQFSLDFNFSPKIAGDYSSFSRIESEKVIYDTLGGGPEYPETPGQTFPVAMLHNGQRVFGLIADSPGRWENRCQILIDPTQKLLSVNTGDGSPSRELKIKYDARDKYECRFDGWQKLDAGETKTYSTWLFASPSKSHFQSQLAAHLALANAKGWNHSALEAILRNTSHFLLRRNLMRNEGKYIFISGIGYGWKQWVSDGFYTSLGLDDPETTIEACSSVFSNRMTYEENAQYYLIWSTLLKRAGGTPNAERIREAYDFIRKNEQNGIYYPPPLPGSPSAKGWKTYMDILEYEHDDPPSSNQGFHCGALMAAQELGLPVTDEEIQRAIDGYRSMFNSKEGYMPTSLKQQAILGQDTLYGATLTYAVFGRKLLTDEQVLAHHEYSLKTASPYGLRVISQADGSLLPNHSGSYVYGGSWFLCDSGNYQLAGIHGLPAGEVDRLLIERIKLEIAHVPAFNESISTVTGEPHGHILYSWNSGYWWIRQQIRKRLGQTGPDPVEEAIDAHLNVVRGPHGLEIRNPAT